MDVRFVHAFPKPKPILNHPDCDKISWTLSVTYWARQTAKVKIINIKYWIKILDNGRSIGLHTMIRLKSALDMNYMQNYILNKGQHRKWIKRIRLSRHMN